MTAILQRSYKSNNTNESRRPVAHPTVARSAPARADAVQGALGDAALIAMLGAVAGHRPDLVRRAVKRNRDGGARVILHQVQLDPFTADWAPTGATTCLDVSGDLPLSPYEDGANTAYADTAYCATLWPAYLEKAFAALDTTWSTVRRYAIPERGYTRLDTGMNVWETAEALAQLTGARSGIRILHPTTAELDIRYRLAHHCPVLIHTPPTTSPAPAPRHGLHPSHAYEITSLRPDGSLQLRNPWGTDHPVLSITALTEITGGVIITLAT